jgi:hypothetical protein
LVAQAERFAVDEVDVVVIAVADVVVVAPRKQLLLEYVSHRIGHVLKVCDKTWRAASLDATIMADGATGDSRLSPMAPRNPNCSRT